MYMLAKRPWWVSAASAAVAMLLAMSASFWVLLPEPLAPMHAPEALPGTPNGTLNGSYWARVLGQAGAPASASDGRLSPSDAVAQVAARPFRLWGVVSDGHGGGYALIGTQDEMPESYASGQPVGDGWVVGAVFERSVQLKPARAGGSALTLQLPPVEELAGATVGVSP